MAEGWTDEELEAAVRAYIDMRDKLRRGELVVKQQYFKDLAAQHNRRTANSFEYRMRNISHVYALLGRQYLPGLRPASNVGRRNAERIQRIIERIEAQAEIETEGEKANKTGTPTENDYPMSKWVVMNPIGGGGGGKSTKASNIKLNMGEFMEAVAKGVLTSTSCSVVPWPITAPVTALVIGRDLYRTAQLDITEDQAWVLYTIWRCKDCNGDVNEDELLDQCNYMFEDYKKPLLSQGQLRASLTELERIKTIERSPRDKRSWWLRESVTVLYR